MKENISDYSVSDILMILELDSEDINTETINNAIDYSIEQYSDDQDMIDFFELSRTKLISAYSIENYSGMVDTTVVDQDQEDQDQDQEDEDQDQERDQDQGQDQESTQADVWLKNQYLPNNDYPISRPHGIELSDGNGAPAMKQKEQKTPEVYSLPFKHGTLNPKLKSTYKRILNIDSQFRENNVPSVKGISYEAITSPVSESIWSSSNYTLLMSEGVKQVLNLTLYSFQLPNTWYNINSNINYFYATTDASGTTRYKIDPGNYTPSTIIDKLHGLCPDISGSYSSITGKITLYSSTFTDITFWNDASFNHSYVNYNLGWILGFRNKSYNFNNNRIVAEAVPDLFGTKYVAICLEDFNHNRINKNLVSIDDCLPRFKTPYGAMDPSALTIAQTYTDKTIRDNNRIKNTKKRAPLNDNIFAIIPLTADKKSFGDLITEFSGSLATNSREYFGPVNIERMRVTLLNDRGEIMDLNGADWSFTMVAEIIYQY